MRCPNCRERITKKDPLCPGCGKKVRHPFRVLIVTSALFILAMGIAIAAFWFKGDTQDKPQTAAKQNPVAVQDKDTGKTGTEEKTEPASTANDQTDNGYIEGQSAAAKDQPKIEKQTMQLEQKEDLTDYINSAKASVFTVTTPEMQGSGFLYNTNGAIVTNAHVVEGWTEATVRSSDGKTYKGKVIGYSNKTDVAVIQIPELAGKQPFPMDASSSINIGDEVVALGSPLGKENTATMGYLTGLNRDFVIGSFTYSHLFQISAPTAPGSSGGPLISKNSQKIIAINSAQSTTNTSIGFSIPLSQVNGLIASWISSPMDEKQLLAQFYGDDGEYVLGEDWDSKEGYFEEGDVSEDKDHYDYWEMPYQDYWKDKDGKKPNLETPPASDKADKPAGNQDSNSNKPNPTQQPKPEDKPSDPAPSSGSDSPAAPADQQKPDSEKVNPQNVPANDADQQKQDIAS